MSRELRINYNTARVKIEELEMDMSKVMWERDRARRTRNAQLLPGLLNKMTELESMHTIALDRLTIAAAAWYANKPKEREPALAA